MTLAYRILREYRGYILPSHRRTFRETLARGQFQKGDEKKRFVYFDFASSQIDIDAGRYSFALVRDFEEAGYVSCYRANFPFLSSMRYKRYKSLLLEREFRVCDKTDEIPRGARAAIITDRARIKNPDTKLLRVSYEHRLAQTETDVIMPFRVYPRLYPQLAELDKIDLESPRPWRAFFAGTITRRYGRDTLEKRFGKMSRLAILHALQTGLTADEFQELKSDHGNERFSKKPSFVLAGSSYRVPQEKWLFTLAKTDFFVACPGGAMPICHNIAESMAAGAIPILEYAEYLDPPLQDGVNCLAFSGREDLLRVMRKAFHLKSQQIAGMRKAAREYYEHYLAPGLFARAIMNSPHRELTLLFNNAHVRR